MSEHLFQFNQNLFYLRIFTFLFLLTFLHDRNMSCLLKYFKRIIRIKVNRHFDVPNVILKIEVVYANVKVVLRVKKN